MVILGKDRLSKGYELATVRSRIFIYKKSFENIARICNPQKKDSAIQGLIQCFGQNL